MTHTKEPWKLRVNEIGKIIVSDDQNHEMMQSIAFVDKYDFEEAWYANARRIVACVNALEGLSNEALEGGWCFKEISAHAKWLEDENASMKKELESERRMFHRAIRELAEIAELCGGDENAIAIDCVKDLLAARQA